MNKNIKLVLDNFEEILASIFIVITTALVLMNVFLRYFMRTGIYWSEEVATSCFVWSVFLGSAAAYKRGTHLGVDLLVNKLPVVARNIVKVITNVILLIINAYILYLSVVFIRWSYIKPTAVLGVSSAWVSSALVVCFGLCTIYSVKNLIICVMKTVKGKEC